MTYRDFDDPILAQSPPQMLANNRPWIRCISILLQFAITYSNNLPVLAFYGAFMEIDRFDRQILRVLQQDGRISNQDLADRIGLSPSPCLRRVRALEEAGIIQSYRALLNAKPLGYALTALIYISMDMHTPERFENFDREIRDIPEVLECLLITGQDADYQIKVIVRDMDAFQELLLNRITRIQGVTGVHSSFVLRRIVDKTEIPV